LHARAEEPLVPSARILSLTHPERSMILVTLDLGLGESNFDTITLLSHYSPPLPLQAGLF
jgi:hypothetical protein